MSRGKLTPVPWQTCLSRTSRRSVLTSGPAALRTVAGLVITHFYQGPKRQNARRGLFLSGFMFCSGLEREPESKRGGARGRETRILGGACLPSAEHDLGLDLRTLRPKPEPKSDAQLTAPPRRPGSLPICYWKQANLESQEGLFCEPAYHAEAAGRETTLKNYGLEEKTWVLSNFHT